MTGKEFLNSLANGKTDILQQLLTMLDETGADYCLIGGLAVNAYVEPVVSLDIDIVVAVNSIERLVTAAKNRSMKIEAFPHSLNISAPDSDLRIQVQTDPRYQTFIADAQNKEVLGYKMKVASMENILQGKVWAYLDETRRKSKRQKDLADIMRIIEGYPHLMNQIPHSIQQLLQI